jgi:hypothetical protein
VGGALIARELAARAARPDLADDFAAGLLRDLGLPLLRAAFPDRWAEHLVRHPDLSSDDPCGDERAAFGIDHADVSAELLRGWKLPDEVVEPIRYHHTPQSLASRSEPQARRAKLLHFADRLTHLDRIVQRPDQLEALLATARTDWNLNKSALIEFLKRVNQIILRLLQKEPGHRFESATALQQALEDLGPRPTQEARPRNDLCGAGKPDHLPTGGRNSPRRHLAHAWAGGHIQLPTVNLPGSSMVFSRNGANGYNTCTHVNDRPLCPFIVICWVGQNPRL